MKTFLKFILLLAAVFMVAGSLLFFAKTRMEPPTPLEDENLHEKKARACVESMSEANNMKTLNKRFYAARQLLGFLGDNKLISTEVADQLMVEMVEKYVPAFADHSLRRLGETQWDDKVLKEISSLMAAVKGLKTSDKKQAMEKASRNTGEQLGNVEYVVGVCDSALVLAKGGKYTGWQNAKKRMARADRFARHPILRNNHHLMERLDSFKMRVEESHYDSLVNAARQLDNYADYSKERFDNIYNNFNQELAHYADSAAVVYGRKSHDVSTLKRNAMETKIEAEGYFFYEPVREGIEDIYNVGKQIYHEYIK